MTSGPKDRRVNDLAIPAPHAFMLAIANYADSTRTPRTLTEWEQRLLLIGLRRRDTVACNRDRQDKHPTSIHRKCRRPALQALLEQVVNCNRCVGRRRPAPNLLDTSANNVSIVRDARQLASMLGARDHR